MVGWFEPKDLGSPRLDRQGFMNDFSSGAAMTEPRRSRGVSEPAQAPQPVDPGIILASLGFLAYSWDIGSGVLSFAGDPLKILPGDWGHRFESVARLEESQAPPVPGQRQAALFGEERLDDGSGIPYALTYRLRSRDGRLFLVEESGRWFAGLPGRSTSARGLLRVRPLLQDERERRDRSAEADGPSSSSAGQGALRQALQRALQQAQRSRRGFALLAAALGADNAGESAASRLRRVMRRGDSLLRIDDEMSLCVLNACDDTQLQTAVKRLEAAFASSNGAPGEAPARRAIVGATWKGNHANAEMLAASVMASARSQLAGQASSPGVARAPRGPGRRRQVDWHAEILHALNERRLVLVFQPVMQAHSRRIVFHEGLLRLRNRAGRLFPASLFIPASEENGLVSLLDRRVIELAAEELRRRPELRLAINASALSLADPEWLETLRAQAAKTGPSRGGSLSKSPNR